LKILWIVNTIFPYPSKMLGYKENVFGGWMLGLLESLNNSTNISIAVATVYNGKELKEYTDKKNIYYLLPCKNNNKYDSKLCTYWEKIIDDYKPDIIHIHGTEYPHSLSCLNIIKDRNIKTVVSIQGLVSFCSYIYLNCLDSNFIKHSLSIRDILKNDSLINQKKKFYKKGLYEKEILKKCDYIIGRTHWDYATTFGIIGKEKYFKCNETLRKDFYNYSWNYDKVEKNSIFFCQASYPIKGFHIFLEALNILKQEFPDVKVYVAGNNIIDNSSLIKKLKVTGYGNYLNWLIKKYNLQQNVKFLGMLTSEEMAKKMLKCNVFVQSSLIENSSNALSEAMLLGMPSVASNVGGTTDTIVHDQEGFLYPCNEYHVLANYLRWIFKNPKEATRMGIKAQRHSKNSHNPQKNLKDMIEIYNTIIRRR